MFKHKQRGFTLLEVIIALSILTIGSLAVFALMHRTIIATEKNRNSIIAVNLAREGMELVRIIRDSNISDVMSVGFDALFTGNFIIDSENFDLHNSDAFADYPIINGCNNCSLYIKDGRYSHDDTGTPTGMKRLINIKPVARNIGGGGELELEGTCVDDEICEKMITVQVLQPGQTQPYTLITHITDWR